MATYTSHYQLHQWEASDSFLRTDFNTDFQKIDAAIKGVETAANTGNGANTRTIDLGCAPRAVFVGEFLAVPGMTSNYLLSLTASGFQVRDSLGTSTNSSGETYYYLALV